MTDYNALDAVNWSTLKALRDSPLHYRHVLANPRPDSDTFRLGRATHCAVLEPDRFALDFVVWTGGRRAGKDYDAFCAAVGDRTMLTEDQYATALAIRDAVRSCPLAMPLLKSGRPELSVKWTDEPTGLACKGRMDWLAPDGVIVDLKTARSIESRAFGQQSGKLGYHNQLAFYADGVVGADMHSYPRAVIIAVESAPPHDVAVYEVEAPALGLGRDENRRLLDRLAECRASGIWPGRYTEPQSLHLPAWMFGDGEAEFIDDQEV